jgi:hypothetical protein
MNHITHIHNVKTAVIKRGGRNGSCWTTVTLTGPKGASELILFAPEGDVEIINTTADAGAAS